MLEFLEKEKADQHAEAEELDDMGARRRALVQMCRVMLNLNEVAYSD